MAFLSVFCVLTREGSIKNVAELKANLSYVNMHIFFILVNLKFEIFIFLCLELIAFYQGHLKFEFLIQLEVTFF